MFQSPIPLRPQKPSGRGLKRARLATAASRPSLRGFEEARKFFANCFASADPARESLFVAYLDSTTCCLHLSRYDGDSTGVAWPMRSILIEAARSNCAGLLVAHNHPSGDVTPSSSDCTATRRLATAAEAIDVTLVDHLLFAGDDCVSFRRMGLL